MEDVLVCLIDDIFWCSLSNPKYFICIGLTGLLFVIALETSALKVQAQRQRRLLDVCINAHTRRLQVLEQRVRELKQGNTIQCRM